MAVGAATASAYLPPALYAGSSATLSGTSTVTSPMTGTPPAPTAALYVKGTLTTSGSSSLSTVTKVIGNTVPHMSVFMPDSRIAALIAASQPARSRALCHDVPERPHHQWRQQDYGNINVTGSLTISGSGTYTFGGST